MKPGSILYERPEEFKTAFNGLMDRMRGRIVANPEMLNSEYFVNMVQSEKMLKHFMETNGRSGRELTSEDLPKEVNAYLLRSMDMTPYEALEYIALKQVDSAQSRSDYKELSRAYNGVSCVAPCKSEVERGVDVMTRSIRNYVEVMMVDESILPHSQLMRDTIGVLDDAYLPFMDSTLADMGLGTALKPVDPKNKRFEAYLLKPNFDPSILDNI